MKFQEEKTQGTGKNPKRNKMALMKQNAVVQKLPGPQKEQEPREDLRRHKHTEDNTALADKQHNSHIQTDHKTHSIKVN